MKNYQKFILTIGFLFVVSLFGIYLHKESDTNINVPTIVDEGRIDSICFDTLGDIIKPDWKDTALTHLKDSEGFRSNVYTGLGGSQLIGYGFTYPRVWGNVHITKEEADIVLEAKFNQYIKIAEADGLKVNRAYAIADFVYNVGKTRYSKSTLRKLILNKATDEEICKELKKWIHAGGKEYRGLIKRRQWESELFCK